MVKKALIESYLKGKEKKENIKFIILKRFTDESGEGFEDGGTIFFVIGLLIGITFVEIAIRGGNVMLVNFITKAQEHINAM